MDGAPRRYEMGGAGPAGNVESAARRARRGRGGELSIATVHAHVNENRPESYWNYDSLQVSCLGRMFVREREGGEERLSDSLFFVGAMVRPGQLRGCAQGRPGEI